MYQITIEILKESSPSQSPQKVGHSTKEVYLVKVRVSKRDACNQGNAPGEGQGSKKQSWAMIYQMRKPHTVSMHCAGHPSPQLRHPLQTLLDRSNTKQNRLPSHHCMGLQFLRRPTSVVEATNRSVIYETRFCSLTQSKPLSQGMLFKPLSQDMSFKVATFLHPSSSFVRNVTESPFSATRPGALGLAIRNWYTLCTRFEWSRLRHSAALGKICHVDLCAFLNTEFFCGIIFTVWTRGRLRFAAISESPLFNDPYSSPLQLSLHHFDPFCYFWKRCWSQVP